MAVHMMTSKENSGKPNVKVLKDYPGAKGDLYMETTYKGCVLRVYERNGYDDSDFYAEVWDKETKSLKRIEYATTRGWTYPNSAVIDATPEVLEEVKEYLMKYNLQQVQNEVQAESERIIKGKKVTVFKGRKVPVGTFGEIFWIGETPYGKKVGLKALDPKTWEVLNDPNKDPALVKRYGNDLVYFTSIDNVKVFRPETYIKTSKDEIVRQAEYRVRERLRLTEENIGYRL